MPPKRFLILPLLTALFVIAATGFSQADTTLQTRNLFGPEQFLRTTGATNVYTRSFNVPSYVSAPYTLHIQNGQPNGAGRLTDAISSGAISINGTEIVHKSDFNQNVVSIDRTITLNAVNTLTVTLDSAPDSFILVVISGVINLGKLNQPRSGHTATLFIDGSVLIAGGQNSSGILASSERFDPLSLAFNSLSGNMGMGRMDHSASGLSDQTTLIVAGQNAGGVIAGAELYDPLTGLFSNLLDAVRIPRSGHTATGLLDGRVLIVGGQSTGVTGSAETFDAQSAILFKPSFDPQAGGFTILAHALSTSRWDHTSTLLSDGKVLIVGGRNESGYHSSAELFDPATETFTPLSSVMTVYRAGHAATLLPDGRVLILGGQNDAGYLASAEIFDPVSGVFSVVSSGLLAPRSNHTATLLPFGEILVSGGENDFGTLDTAEFYGPPPTDSVSPVVVAVSPSDGATGVDLTEIIGVRFSEPVDVTTLYPGSISLTGSALGGGAVDSMIGPSASGGEQGLMVFLVPKTKLSPGTAYALSLTSAVRDTSGNPLVPYTTNFTTVPAPIITGVTPNHAPGGAGVTITGQNFDPSAPTKNVVKFGGVNAVVASATATQIETSVPSDATVGAGNLAVTTRGGTA
ncbi:MAG: Ig-like domain-containing protein, partial [Nitrospirae bacterium]|nr:Ig-like domain-containing protein [Nitrospirota bacterium]